MNTKKWMIDFFLEQIGEGKAFLTRVDMARYLGLPQTQATKLFNFLKGSDTQYSAVLEWFEKLGGKLAPPDEEPIKEVCFVDAKVTQAGEHAMPPDSEKYLAVPLVGEAGAGPGIIPQDEIYNWVLVMRNHGSITRRSNLLAVEVGKNQRSMIPTLHPGDIVLVDRDDWGQDGFRTPGNIFLVREPGQDGGGKVKRVSMSGKGESAILTFYSDNSFEHEPEPHFLYEYEYNLREAIVGRVVWAWADLSRK